MPFPTDVFKSVGFLFLMATKIGRADYQIFKHNLFGVLL